MPVEQLIAEVCEFLVVTQSQASEDAVAACLEQQKDIIMSHLRSSTVTRTEATASLKRLQESPFEFAARSEITSLMMAKVLAAAQTNTTCGDYIDIEGPHGVKEKFKDQPQKLEAFCLTDTFTCHVTGIEKVYVPEYSAEHTDETSHREERKRGIEAEIAIQNQKAKDHTGDQRRG